MTTYKQSGVHVAAGNLLVKKLRAKMAHIGGFAGIFPLTVGGTRVLLVGSADGVGTKLKLAFRWNAHDGVGIDLVAMNVNDLICCGAKPLFFLDYYATGKLSVRQAERVINGIQAGCAQAGCVLLGGETAEMPGFYKRGEYDLAGFAVGLVEPAGLIDGKRIRPGDAVIGLPSSGPHSNGFSLVRRALAPRVLVRHRRALLAPTRIYVRDVERLKQKRIDLRGLCHITGGGFYDNIPRILPVDCGVRIAAHSWRVPAVFAAIQEHGKVPLREMFAVFNMGIGMIAVVPARQAAAAAAVVRGARVIGTVVRGERRVLIEGV